MKKKMAWKQEDSRLKLEVVEGFCYHDPHYLIIHGRVENKSVQPLVLSEQHTVVYVNSRKFKPSWVFFDAAKLAQNQQTDIWLILQGTFISLDNGFCLGIGVNNEEYVFREN